MEDNNTRTNSMDGNEPQAGSTILTEEIDPSYEPTEEEVLEYAKWLGMDLEVDQQLLWIVKEGLKAPLPSDWRPCETKDTKEMYYFNFKTGESTWDHPCDTYYRELYDAEKRRLSDGNNLISSEAKKRKEAERKDIQELLKPPPPAPIDASMPRTFLAGAAADLKLNDNIQLANNSPFGSPLNTRTPLPGIGSMSSSTKFSRSLAMGSSDRQGLRQVESRPVSSRFPDNRMKPLALATNDAIGDSEERGLMSPLSRPNARHDNREPDYQARHTSRKELRNSRSSETTRSQDDEARGSDESDYEEFLQPTSSPTYDYSEDSAASEKYTQNQSGRRQQLQNSRGEEQKLEVDAIERSFAQAIAEARKQGEKALERVEQEYRDKVELVEDALSNEQQRLEKARCLADDEFATADRLKKTREERQLKLAEELKARENELREATSKLHLRLQQAQEENSQIESEIVKNRAQKVHELEELEICRKDAQRARDEVREVEDHKTDLKAKIDTYQARLETLKNEVAVHVRKHNELDQDIVEKTEEKSRLEIELADVGKLRQKAQDELDKIHDELGDEQRNRELQGVESHEIQEQLQKIREEERSRATSKAEEQINATNAKIEELQKVNSLLGVDLAATETRLRDESSNFHAQIADLEKQLEELSVRANTEGVLSPSSQKLANIEKERDALSEELNRKSQLIEHLEGQLEGEQLRHSTELQQATDVISKNLNESELHKVIEKEQTKSEQLLRDLHIEREARENFDIEKRKLLEQIRCVEEERDERKKAQEDLEYKYNQLQQQANKDISSELEVSRVDLDRLKQLNKRLVLERKQVEEQRNQYEHERNHLAQELASIQEQESERSSALSQEVADSCKALQDVQQELDICRKQLKGAELRNEQLVSKAYRVSLDAETQAELKPQMQLSDASQNAQLEQQQALNTRLAKEIEHLQNELSSTAREANRLRTELATVSQKLAQHETDQENVSNLQQQIEEAKQETARAVESCKIAEAARAETIKAGATANENALEEIELERAKVHSLQTQLLNAQIQQDKGQLAKQQLDFQLENSVSECRLLHQKVDQLSKELHAVSTDKAALESRLSKMELGHELKTEAVSGVPNSRSEDPQHHVEHIERLETEVKQFQDRNSEVNDLLKKTISDREYLREEVARQKALIVDLKDKLRAAKAASDPLLNSHQSVQAQLANIPQELDSEVSLAQQFVQTATEEEEILSEAKTNVLERIQLEEKYMSISKMVQDDMLRKILLRGLKKLTFPSRSSSLLAQLSLIEDLIQLRHEVLANANLLLECPTSDDAKLAFETSHNRLREKQRSATRIEQHKHKFRSTRSEVLESDTLSDSETEDSNTENDSMGGNLPNSHNGQTSSRRSESTPMVWPHQSCTPPIVPPGVYPFQHCVSYPPNHGIVYVDGQGNFILPTASAPHGTESRHKRSFTATAMENQHVAKGYSGTTNSAWMGNPGVFTDTLHNSVVSLDHNQNSVVNDPALHFDQIESKWVQRREIAAQHSAWLLNFRKDMHRNPSLLSHDRPERAVLRPKKRSSRKRRALTGSVNK